MISDGYVTPDPTLLQYGRQLVGERITIYWDGDDVFYPARILDFIEDTNMYKVVYENDESEMIYEENLTTSTWKIWRGSDEEYMKMLENMKAQQQAVVENVPEEVRPEPITMQTPSKTSKSNKTPSYSVMVMEAVIALDDSKNGTSLSAIRKYIITNYGLTKRHVASFNNLTLKAVNKCVAANELEKIKHSFRLTPEEREKRKIFDKAKFDERGRLIGANRKNSPFVIDLESLYSSVLAHNKVLRAELLNARDRRDHFLIKKWAILKPFLPEKDYFIRRLLDERDRPERRNLTPVIEGTNLMRIFYNFINQQEQEQMLESSSALDSNQHPNTTSNVSKMTVSEGETKEEDSELLHDALDGVVTIEQPEILTATLHEHQIIGISWLVHMFQNGMPMILGDQMGLGKTIQTIGFLAYLHEKLQKRGPHLIVVPLSVLSNWLAEIEKFCPTFRAVRFHGPKGERDRIKQEELKNLDDFDIVVTTFEILVAESNYFRHRYVWTSIIVDEGHRLKNEKSQLSEKIRCIPCISKLILTGTPLQNNLHELWAMLHFLAPDLFSTSEPFDDGFNLAKGIIDSTILRAARKLLSVFMLRRLKDMVAIALPSRKEVTMLVPLTEHQNDLYRQFLCALDSNTIEVVMNEANQNNNSNNNNSSSNSIKPVTSESDLITTTNATDTPEESDSGATTCMKVERTTTSTSSSGDSDWRKLMNLLLQLRKICNHPYLLPGIAPEPYQITEDIIAQSGKLTMLDRMLPALREDGHRVLIFSQFTSMLDLLEDYCELRNYPYVRLDGETNRVRRRLDVRRFNAPGSNLFIFLISTRAGGLGLNLATADTVILYDSDWNPQVDLQAMERAHRIGQTKPVRVFRLICRGSVEERMVSRAEKKLFLNAMVAERDPDEELDEHGQNGSEILEALGIGGTAMSKGELASLIRFGANAVFDSADGQNGADVITDQELYKLLERQGRDKIYRSPVSMTSSTSDGNMNTTENAGVTTAAPSVVASTVEVITEVDTFEKAQQALKERMEKLQEVDLRQLGNILYKSSKPERKLAILDQLSEDAIIRMDSKRQRKERIVMVDGKGTGYGGAVPVLAETIDRENSTSNNNNNNNNGLTDGQEGTELVRSRGRQWRHCDFCNFCGKNAERKAPYTRCAHCPLVFHNRCAEEQDLFVRLSGMFICPHHRCGLCNRPTSAAGGLLFRCIGCLTAYCEDCLPQDQIESLGRCRELEVFDYFSKQAYFIKCPCCCKSEGVNPLGILNDQRPQNETTESEMMNVDVTTTASEENGDTVNDGNSNTSNNNSNNGQVKNEEVEDDATANAVATNNTSSASANNAIGESEDQLVDEEEDEVIILPTHSMKLLLLEIPDPPPKKRERRERKKKTSRKRARTSRGATSRQSGAGETSQQQQEEGEDEGDDNEEDIEDVEEDGEDNPHDESDQERQEQEEQEMEAEEITHPIVPEGCSLAQGLSLILDHPILARFQRLSKETVNTYEEFSWVSNKVEAGRYRSVGLFLADVKFTIEGKIEKKVASIFKANRRKPTILTKQRKELLVFIQDDLAQHLTL